MSWISIGREHGSVVALPESFLTHLRERAYHPRSDKHSNALAETIVATLVTHCQKIKEDARRRHLVWQTNHYLQVGHTTWKTDLAIGLPPLRVAEPQELLDAGMERGTPATTRIAIEIKGVMSEHRKAVQNRKRDLEAHHLNVHNYDPLCIAGGVLVINAAPTFRSPLRAPGVITRHKNPQALVKHCVDQVASLTLATGANPTGLDAVAALVVNMDNVNLAATSWVNASPAPQIGSPFHWDSFVQRICNEYTRRFP